MMALLFSNQPRRRHSAIPSLFPSASAAGSGGRLAAGPGAGTAAQAQSSVTLFGVIDTGYTHLSSSGSGSNNLVAVDGNTSSRIGFRGSEDLGGGLKASFWLEAAYESDTGAGGSTSTDNVKNVSGGLTFGRRSTVSLSGNWGELRLARLCARLQQPGSLGRRLPRLRHQWCGLVLCLVLPTGGRSRCDAYPRLQLAGLPSA